MRIPEKLDDNEHPLVRATAYRLTQGLEEPRDQLRALFYYVRDDILFGFANNADIMKASETIQLGYGACNNKATVLLALVRAVGLESRIHFSTISKDIQRGVFPEWAFKRLPEELSHSWVEVEIDGRWRRIDSFINDEGFYCAGKKALRERGWKTGFSISCESGESDSEFNIDQERFVQMDAVTSDHGIYEDPADYYRSPLYLNRPGFLKLLMYRLIIGAVNRKVAKMRKECPQCLCGEAA